MGASWYEMLTGHPPSREHLAAKKVISPIPSSSPLGQLLMRMLSYGPENRPALSRVLSVLRKESPFDVSEVESVVRAGLTDQRHPDVPQATVAVTAQILTRLGLSPILVRQYLASYGYRKPPMFRAEDGEFSRHVPDDVLDEMAIWVADEILNPPMVN